MSVRTRSFGRTGWEISEISFGAWQIGGQWGAVDDEASVGTLLAAYELGVNFVDTAEMYGSGHSERIVGRSLRAWRSDDVRIATKVQPVAWPLPSDQAPAIGPAYPPEYLRTQVEQSLGRLDVERIDLLQLHCWMPSGLDDRTWLETLQALQREGKIDRIGVSLRDHRADEGVALARAGLVDSVQVIYNVFEQRPEAELLPAAAASGTAVIVRVALDSGSLSGTWTPETYDGWEDGSVQKTLFRGDRFREVLDRVQRLGAIAVPRYADLAEAALRFVLDRPEVSTTIVGTTTAAQLSRNLRAADGAGLDPAVREAFRAFQWDRNFYA